MNWNYRVLCRPDNDGVPYFAVHEVYYDAEGKPTSWTCDAASPIGENVLELAVDAARMAAACGLPVLAVAADNTLHQYPDCGCERCGKKQSGSAPAGAKEACEALERAASAAESADPLASKDHDLARQAAEETAAEVRAEVARLQARIDALMLEYCPGEMTPDQTAEWARHQVRADETSELSHVQPVAIVEITAEKASAVHREWHFDRYRNGRLMAQGVKVVRAATEEEAWEIARSLLHLDGNLPSDELRLSQNGSG